jgi:hypothetical protein
MFFRSHLELLECLSCVSKVERIVRRSILFTRMEFRWCSKIYEIFRSWILVTWVDPKTKTATMIPDLLSGQAEVMAKPPEALRTDSNVLAPFTPTGEDAQRVGLRLLQLRADDVFFDIGCGDGRVVITAAAAAAWAPQDNGTVSESTTTSDDNSARIRCIGIELDPVFCAKAMAAIRKLPEDAQQRVQIRCGDILDPAVMATGGSTFGTDGELSENLCNGLTFQRDCTAVYLYLLPQGLRRLKPILDGMIEERRRRRPVLECKSQRRSFRVVTYMFQIHGWTAATVDRTSKAEAPVYLYEFHY